SLDFPYTRRYTNDGKRLGADKDAVSNTVRKIVRERLRQLSTKAHSLTNRPLFNGPILANPDTTDIEDQTSRLVNSVPHEREYVRNGWHSDSSLHSQRALSLSNNITTTTPSTITDTSASFDYHYRTVAPIKKYKFTQKLRQRPRLRIRRPGESQQPIRGNRTAASARPLTLPMLTPFTSQSDSTYGGGNQRPPWSSHESNTGNDEKTKIDERSGESRQDSETFGGGSASEFGTDTTRFSGAVGSSRESGKPMWSSHESTSGRFGGGNGKVFIGNKGISESSGERNGGDDGLSANGEENGDSNAGFEDWRRGGGQGTFGGGSDSFGGGSGRFGGGSGGFGSGSGTSGGSQPPIDFGIESFGLNGPNVRVSTELTPIESSVKSSKSVTSVEQFASSSTNNAPALKAAKEEFVIPQNSGLRSVAPPAEFQDGFGSFRGGSNLWSPGSFGGGSAFGRRSGSSSFNSPPDGDSLDSINSQESENLGPSRPNESIFTGESALTPNRNGPTGDGFGPPLFPGAAVPPPVPAISLGGEAAGLPPYHIDSTVRNPPSTVKPSALLSVLNKADLGFNQAINHFEQGTPLESAAIDILEVALGSQKLDSQAKLLGHVDRTIGIDNLQRLQRWANTGGALDAIKEQFAKIAKNYSPPENLLPTIPPQFNYLFTPTGKR
uniref:Uncharacterized protein n=1 Tax=Parascaris univalens TaxID=6257 RepID=A0A915C8I2_PARUN